MVQDKKSVTPYKSMDSRCEGNCLVLQLDASDPEDSIRFAYGLHVSLLPVVHAIYVNFKGEEIAAFFVNTPNHGNK